MRAPGPTRVALVAALLGTPAAPQVAPEPPPIPAARAPAALPYAPGVDVLHYDLEIGVSDRADWMAGRARVRARVAPEVRELRLDLTGLAVEGVRVDGADVPATLVEGVLLVPLRAGAAGDTVMVDVAYRGTPDDALHLGPTLHGSPSAFADNWPNRARFWFPSVDHPSDKATVRFRIHAPADWVVVANGTLVEGPLPTAPDAPGPPAGARSTWVWETLVPIPTYTMVFGAADMVIRSMGRAACGRAPASRDPDGCVDVSWWAFAPDTAAAARIFARAPEMVDVFTDLLGPFPYEKLANVQSATRFGGMENASAIFYSAAALSSGRLSPRTVAHEIAHQWFGDAVTEAEWSHVWLSEGFATYFAAVFYERTDGVEAFRQVMEDYRRDVLRSPWVGRPVVAGYGDLYDVLSDVTYDKAAWVLHMLRDVVGDEAFFDGVRSYLTLHWHGTALTEDFQRAVEDASGQDLEWFFRQWLFEPGLPVLEVRQRWEDGAVEVEIRQVQPPAWPRFRLPVEVRVESTGETTRVWLEGADGVFRVPAPSPGRVLIDPDQRVLRADVRYR